MHARNPVRPFFVAALLAGSAAAETTLFQGPTVALATRGEAALDSAALLSVPQSGQVVITEIMKDPSSVADTRGEYFEVWNALPWRVNLEGWTISDDSGASHVINTGGAGLRMGPGKYLILGNSSDPALNGGVQVDYAWSSFSLGNGADQIQLTKPDGTVVDRVAYDDGMLWPDLAGRSLSLRVSGRDVVANDDPANWCSSSSAISGTNADMGTPRRDNDICP